MEITQPLTYLLPYFKRSQSRIFILLESMGIKLRNSSLPVTTMKTVWINGDF